jgi:hypothetical protein
MIFVPDFSPPFGTLEAEDEGEEVVSHLYVPSTPPEELGRSCAMPSSFGKKPLPHTTFIAARVATCIGTEALVSL